MTKKRLKISVFFNFLIFLTLSYSAYSLDPVYHNNEEIYAELQRLKRLYPDYIAVDSIGHSSEYELPIWMAKISDFPERIDPEPALLFVGQVHAEEVEGVEVTLHLMNLLLSNMDDEAFSDRINGLELYFIPTANPEGLRVVHSGQDETFRKNCRDNIGDGEFRFREGWGWDTSGVDLNRNFGLHWDRGLGLFEREDEAAIFNYYRGPAPFSEPEAEALARLGLERRFQYSIVYHSSRSGQNSETVIAPWNWDFKYPADANAIDAVLNEIAGRIPLQNGGGFYDPVHALQRVGQSPDWFYQATGTFQYMIEIGAGIQPDSTVLMQLIDEQVDAALFLMDLANSRESIDGFGILTVIVSDAATGEPLEAEIIIGGLDDPVLETRRTVGSIGRFDWLLDAENYDIEIRAHGYEPHIAESFIREDRRNFLTVELEPVDRARIHFRASDEETNQWIQAVLQLSNDSGFQRTINLSEIGTIVNLPLGAYRVEAVSEGYVPYVTDLEATEGRFYEIEFESAETAYDEEFSEMQVWQRGGVNQDWDVIEYENRFVLTESENGAYPPDAAVWLLLETGLEFDSTRNTVMRLIHRPYFEPGVDSGKVIIWDWENRNNQLVTAAAFSKFPSGWDTTYIDLNRFKSGELWIRLMVISDDAVEEDGWLIDRLTVFQSKPVSAPLVEENTPRGIELKAFPNPTNGLALIYFYTPVSRFGTIKILDSTGRLVETLSKGVVKSGNHKIPLSISNYTSGVYFVRFESDNIIKTIPINLIE